jgi:RHS repeat-associated protein
MRVPTAKWMFRLAYGVALGATALAVSPIAKGTISLVQHASTDAGTAASASLTFTSNNTAGNFIAVCIRAGHISESFSVMDSLGNTYRQAVAFSETVNGNTLGIFYAENTAGGSNTVTVNISTSSTLRFIILEYSGIALANSIDENTAAQGTSTSPNSGSMTTTTNGDLLLSAILSAGSATFTAGSGYTLEESIPASPNTKLIAEDQIQTTAGAVSAGATLSVSTQWAAGLAAFKPAPVITNLSPTSGVQGTLVTINGNTFGSTQGNSTITFNGVAVTPTSWSATSIVAPVPTGTSTGNVVVTVAGIPSNGSRFSLLPGGITLIQHSSKDVAQTTSSTLSFTSNNTAGNFIAVCVRAGHSGEVFTISDSNGNTYTQAVFLSETLDTPNGHSLAIFYAKNIAAGANTVTVSDTISGTLRFAILEYSGVATSSVLDGTASAQGSSISPNSGNATTTASGDLLLGAISTADPASFVAGSGYSTKESVPVEPGTKLIAEDWIQTTAGTTSASVTLAASDPWGAVFAAFKAASVGGGTPNITSISPTSATVGTSITVNGSNFGATQGSSSLFFNGGAATSITSWSNTQIVALVPNTASTGPVTVVVNSVSSNSNVTFTLTGPALASLQPPNAPQQSTITLNGAGFGATKGSSTVSFNGSPAGTRSWSDTSISAVVPSNATSGPVTVTVNGLTSNSLQFTVIEALSVTSFSPASGPVGTSVTINGTGFGSVQSNSIASFWGATATITSWTDTQIVATVPQGAATGPISVQVAGNVAYSSSFFTLTRTVQMTDSLGNATTFTAQLIGGQWRVTDSQGSGCSTCTVRGNTHSTYDVNGNRLTYTDENGNLISYTYDASNNLTSVVQPLINGVHPTTTYTYNSFGEVLTSKDPIQNAANSTITTTYTYDANGNLKTVTTPKPDNNTAGSLTQFNYNSLGELTSIIDPLNNTATLTYTTPGLIATIVDAQNNTTTYAYDTHGNRTSVTDALTHQTTFTYDAMERLTKITYPDTTTTQFAYDIRGRRTSVTDQNSKVTSYTYDDADRLLTVKDAANNVTTYGYDSESNLTSIKDANNHTTSFNYDAFRRLTKTTFPATLIETYGYDSVGNLTSKTDRKNQLINYTYDQLNRLTQKSYPDTSTVNYTYDLDSRLTQVTDPTGTYQFTFDNMGRLTGTTTSYAFLTGRNFTTSYTYDAASNRTGFTDPESGVTSYVYDTLNRLQTLTPPTAFTATGNFGFTYDALSRRTQMTRPNTITTTYAYDNLSRLLSVLHKNGPTTLDGASYTVDNAGNRTSKTDQRAGVTSNYTYDAIYELTQVTQTPNTTESYTYDAVGNRLSSLGASPYNYNSSNELTSRPGTSDTYDNNGNTLTSVSGSNTTTYAWDFENRLTSITLPGSGGTVSFKYDPFGRRIYKSSSSGTSDYAYDGDNLIEETNSSGAAVARYAQTTNVDEPLAMLRNGTTSYYEQDALGTVTSLSSGAGSLVQTYTFDSFGKTIASSGSLTNPFQYTNREVDSETNLYFYRARYYDQTIGRFLSEDPIRFSGGVDFYSYTKNNGVNAADPSGLRTQLCCRPVTGAVSWSGKKHCFVVVSGNPAINGGGQRTYSLFPTIVTVPSWTPLGPIGIPVPIGVPSVDDPRDLRTLPGGSTGGADCQDVSDCGGCKEQNIDTNASDPGRSGLYLGITNNSNTYASSLLKRSGCKAPKVSGAPGY